jgi:predicted DNA binding CopG/RHH family protein
MVTKKPLLKAKAKASVSHNPAITELVNKVQAEADIPFQVRLPESLAKRVKVYSAESGATHRTIVMEALEAYMKGKTS